MADRQPLPLATEKGPVCRGPECPCFEPDPNSREYGRTCTADPLVLGPFVGKTECRADERAAWLREQRRKREVCGRCGDFDPYQDGDGFHGMCDRTLEECKRDNYCSWFEEPDPELRRGNCGHQCGWGPDDSFVCACCHRTVCFCKGNDDEDQFLSQCCNDCTMVLRPDEDNPDSNLC